MVNTQNLYQSLRLVGGFIFVLGLLFGLGRVTPLVQADGTQVTCQIDFTTETDTCRDVPEIISFYTGSDVHQEAVVRVNMNPANGYDQLRVELDYGSPPSEWSFNLGDSETNNGFAGDSGTQSRDAELQIYNSTLALYASDHVTSAETLDGHRQIGTEPNFVSAGDTVSIIVRDSFVQWTNQATGLTNSIESGSIFALNGQDDFEGDTNYDLYLGINRVISSAFRSGEGVERVRITLEQAPRIYDACVIPESGPWPPCATGGNTPPPNNSDCIIPESGPWPPCATGGNTPPPNNGDCVIPESGPWPPCATGGTPPPNSGDCIIPESGPWPPCATGGAPATGGW